MSGKNKSNCQSKRGTHGQSLLEMALMLPFLLFMILSILNFGRFFYTKIVITNAAREGAYYLSIHPSDFENGTAAAQAEAANSGISDITVAITPKYLEGYNSIEITVETTVSDLLILNFLNNTLTATNNDGFHLSSSAEMMIQ